MHGINIEADTRVIFSINHAEKNDNGDIIVRRNDVDTARIHTCNADILSNSHLYGFDVDFNNRRDYLDITKLSKVLTYMHGLPGT